MATKNNDRAYLRREPEFGEEVDPFAYKEHHLDGETTRYDTDSAVRDLNEKIEQANEKFKELTEDIQKAQKSVETKLNIGLTKVRQEINESKSRVVETLALFAALFTFLSIQVQIFKEEKDADRALGLVLITGGLITFFVLILDLMVKTKDDAKNFLQLRFFLLLGMSVALIVAGLAVFKLQ